MLLLISQTGGEEDLSCQGQNKLKVNHNFEYSRSRMNFDEKNPPFSSCFSKELSLRQESIL
jgi:hypothetical protein